jgi:hypothetical protein
MMADLHQYGTVPGALVALELLELSYVLLL